LAFAVRAAHPDRALSDGWEYRVSVRLIQERLKTWILYLGFGESRTDVASQRRLAFRTRRFGRPSSQDHQSRDETFHRHQPDPHDRPSLAAVIRALRRLIGGSGQQRLRVARSVQSYP